MQEILKDSAYFFNGRDEKEMGDAMKKVLEDDELRKALIEKGLNQIKKYSWERMASETLEIYKK
jgi:glycosyltransferase involved in cell wall biosynthesis